MGGEPGNQGRRVGGVRPAGVVLAVALVLGSLALVAPTARAAAPMGASAAAPGPTLETFELPSPLVDTAKPGGFLEARRTAPKIQVLLPVGYAENPNRRYPVLWLLHGANGGTDTWNGWIQRLLPGFPGIIVLPDGAQFGMYLDWWNGGARGGPAWATYHLDLLRQTIEDRYRIRPERRWHAIGGISMGGQGALRYAALLPGYFGSVAGFSAALPDMQAIDAQVGLGILGAVGAGGGATYEDIYGPADGEYAEGNSPAALVANLGHTRIYLSAGSGIHCLEDSMPATFVIDTITELFIHRQQGPFAAEARAAGADVTSVATCGSHNWGVWDRSIPEANDWGFFGRVAEHPDEWTYRTIAATGEMWGLRFRFAAPPAEVIDFERDGTRFTGSGHGEVVISGPPGSGCELRLGLPFRTRLPPACQAVG